MTCLMTSEKYYDIADELETILNSLTDGNYNCVDQSLIDLVTQAKDKATRLHETAINDDQVYDYYKIPSEMLPAIINGDNTGLDDSDIVALDKFLTTLPSDGNWVYDNYDYFTNDPDIINQACTVTDCYYIILDAE